MLVLLAGCLDLLVPMGSLKRYVRMTMGLLVMISLINPVLSLWKADVRIEEVLAQQEIGLPSLQAVQAEASRYRSQIDGQVEERLRQQVEARASEAAQRVDGVGEAFAQAELTPGEDQTPLLTGIQVYIMAKTGSVTAVQPVEPVALHGEACGPQPCAEQHGADVARRSGAPFPDAALAARVKQAVAAALSIDPDLVAVLAKEAR